MNAYFLAMCAKANGLAHTAYENGVKSRYVNHASHDITDTTSLQNEVLATDLILTEDMDTVTLDTTSIDSLLQVSVFKDTILYGLSLKLSDLSENLLKVYTPFFTINPHELKDNGQNYSAWINNFSHAIKRRDNEIGVGTTNSEIWGFYQRKDSTQSYRINPAIGAASMFVDKDLGLKTLAALYNEYAEVLFTEYGFRAWLDLRNSDVSDEYMALNQASIAILIENARSGLIWKLYQEIPAMKTLQNKLFEEK